MNIKKLIKEEIDNLNRKYYIEWSAIGGLTGDDGKDVIFDNPSDARKYIKSIIQNPEFFGFNNVNAGEWFQVYYPVNPHDWDEGKVNAGNRIIVPKKKINLIDKQQSDWDNEKQKQQQDFVSMVRRDKEERDSLSRLK